MHGMDSVISVVDDDRSVRNSLKRLLRSMGFEVRTFASAFEFLQQGPFHDYGCVIVDVRMPGMNGLDFQKRLQDAGILLPIIFITAYDDPGVCERAMHAGSVAFLQKPLSESLLTNAIEAALERSSQHVPSRSKHVERDK